MTSSIIDHTLTPSYLSAPLKTNSEGFKCCKSFPMHSFPVTEIPNENLVGLILLSLRLICIKISSSKVTLNKTGGSEITIRP